MIDTSSGLVYAHRIAGEGHRTLSTWAFLIATLCLVILALLLVVWFERIKWR